MTDHDHKKPRIIVALDYANIEEALALVSQLDPEKCRLKVGKHMYTRFGPKWVTMLQDRGFSVFLDLKFHDIPNTVADACYAAGELGVWMVNVHALGGVDMMKAAKKAIDKLPVSGRPLLIAVTVLTSFDEVALKSLGISLSLEAMVLKLAKDAKAADLDGVVCSAHEAVLLRDALGPDFLLVTPGIRMSNDMHDDQKRVMTPALAFAAGADYLVMGRSITGAKYPQLILDNI